MSDSRSSSLEQQTANPLLTEIYNSNLEAAKATLKEHPELLSEADSIGEHKQIKPLELARELRDFGFYEMLLACNRDPNNVKPCENTAKKAPLDVMFFSLVLEAIATAGRSTVYQELHRYSSKDAYQETELGRALDAFRAACDKHGETTMQDIVNAIEVFNKHYHAFNNWMKVKLFFIQVIGYIERQEPAWFRQALHQGTKNLLSPDVELQRVSECKVNDKTYSLTNPAPHTGLGYEFAFDDRGVVPTSEPVGKRFLFWRRDGHLGSYLGPFPSTIKNFCDDIESRFNQLENGCNQERSISVRPK